MAGVPLWVWSAFDSIPSVEVKHTAMMMGFATVDFRIGTFDDYNWRTSEAMAMSSVSFAVLADDGSRAIDPGTEDRFVLDEMAIHLPPVQGIDKAREIGRRMVVGDYHDTLVFEARPLTAGWGSPHIHYSGGRELEVDDVVGIVVSIVKNHSSFEYDPDEHDPITRDDIDQVVAAAERLRGDDS